MTIRRTIVLPLLAVLVLAACGPELTPEAPAVAPATSTPAVQATLEPTAEAVEEPESRSPGEISVQPQEAMATRAIMDLAQRLGMSPEQVKVVSVEEVEWPNASLGCPAPGMMYAQVLVNGMKVVLEADGQTYDYHGRAPDDLFLCGPDGPVKDKLPPAEGSGQRSTLDPEAVAMIKTVTEDMAQQLGVSASEIEVLSVESVQWRNSGLGCEQQGKMYLQVITPGQKIVLASGSDVFEYHTDEAGRYVLCAQTKR